MLIKQLLLLSLISLTVQKNSICLKQKYFATLWIVLLLINLMLTCWKKVLIYSKSKQTKPSDPKCVKGSVTSINTLFSFNYWNTFYLINKISYFNHTGQLYSKSCCVFSIHLQLYTVMSDIAMGKSSINNSGQTRRPVSKKLTIFTV